MTHDRIPEPGRSEHPVSPHSTVSTEQRENAIEPALFPLDPGNSTLLRPLGRDDAATLFETIDGNRAHLDPWLRWSGRVRSEEDAQAHIVRFEAMLARDDGFHAGMWRDGRLIGGTICHFINHESRKSELGYWLVADAVGHGYVDRACRVVIDRLFRHYDLHRVELQCATDNVRSRAVAERLGFALEGIKRESEWLTTRFADHAIYSLLRHEWEGAMVKQWKEAAV